MCQMPVELQTGGTVKHQCLSVSHTWCRGDGGNQLEAGRGCHTLGAGCNVERAPLQQRHQGSQHLHNQVAVAASGVVRQYTNIVKQQQSHSSWAAGQSPPELSTASARRSNKF